MQGELKRGNVRSYIGQKTKAKKKKIKPELPG